MKRRSFFGSLFVAPVVAACAAATVKPAMAAAPLKPAAPLGEMIVQIKVNTFEFEEALAQASQRLRQFDAEAARAFARWGEVRLGISPDNA